MYRKINFLELFHLLHKSTVKKLLALSHAMCNLHGHNTQ